MPEKIKRISAMPRPTAPSEPLDPKALDGFRRLRPFEETGELVEVCIANGRSVQLPSPDGAKRVVGYNAEKEQHVYALVQDTFGPGERIKLRESEATRLMELGYVVWPEAFVPLPPRKAVDETEVHRYGPEPQ